MAEALDILALEPYYGGVRRAMLEILQRASRHHWTLLKLPPRRIERRLEVAAQWFGEQLSRHGVGGADILFLSEAINLAELLRLVPELASRPAVVYFHDNQLPTTGSPLQSPYQVVNISSAAAATEIWFNSEYHRRIFLKRALALVEQLPEISGHNPVTDLEGKSRVMPPPVDHRVADELRRQEVVKRDPRMLCVDTREADIALLNEAMRMLARREKFRLCTVGPSDGLDEDLPVESVSDKDPEAEVRALLESSVVVSTRAGALCDLHAVRALHLGCWPIFPRVGCYAELLPQSLHPLCLYESGDIERMVNQMQNVWWIAPPAGYQEELAAILGRFDAECACRAIDDRLEQLVIAASLG